MKILKAGDPEKRIGTIQFECQFCGCIFEVDNGEYDVDSLYWGDGRMDTCNAQCPNCGHMCARRFEYNM